MGCKRFFFLSLLFSVSWFEAVNGQPRRCEQGQCQTGNASVTVKITIDETYRYVETNGCPPYKNPYWTNPGHACIQTLNFRIPLNQTLAKEPVPVGEAYERYDGILYLKEDPAPIMGAMGVLKSGVMVFGVGSPCGYSSKCPDEGAPTKYVDAVESEGHTVDQCGGHPAPTGQYHVHSEIGFNTSEGRGACKLPKDTVGQHSELLGWMFDGFGLYGHFSLDGRVPTDLDSCGGHTHEIDGVNTYHYHLPDSFPWTIGCFTGCPEVSNNRNEFKDLSKYGC